MYKILVVIDKINTQCGLSHILEFKTIQEADKAAKNILERHDYTFTYRIIKLY
jgi:hypothetical protein